jgi:hypothetical protein
VTNKVKLLIAIGLVVVVAAAAWFFVIHKKSGAPTEVAQAPAEKPAAPAATSESNNPSEQAPPSASPSAPPAQPGQEAAPAKPAAPSAVPGQVKEPFRVDPFGRFPRKPRPPVPPTPMIVRLNLPVNMVRVFETVSVGEGPGARQRRRVAGLLYDDRVWALYEDRGQLSVVKPGDIVEGGTVKAITDEGLLLQEPGNPKPVLVPLTRGSTPPPAPIGTRPGLYPMPGFTGPAMTPPGMPGPAAPGPSNEERDRLEL